MGYDAPVSKGIALQCTKSSHSLEVRKLSGIFQHPVQCMGGRLYGYMAHAVKTENVFSTKGCFFTHFCYQQVPQGAMKSENMKIWNLWQGVMSDDMSNERTMQNTWGLITDPPDRLTLTSDLHIPNATIIIITHRSNIIKFSIAIIVTVSSIAPCLIIMCNYNLQCLAHLEHHLASTNL